MKSWIWGLAIAAIASTGVADQLVLTGQTKEGSFQKYENGRFEFVTTKGRFLKERAERVTKLVLSSPMKVVYLTTGSKKEDSAELKGYEKKTFTFTKKDQEATVALSKVKTIERAFEEGEGGDGDGGSKSPIPEIDVDSFAGDDLTPAQQSALDGFKAARKKYDDFVAESSALVVEMDKQTGAKREALLNELRERKNDEQPLRKALTAAYNRLADAFPEPSEEPATKPAKPQK